MQNNALVVAGITVTGGTAQTDDLGNITDQDTAFEHPVAVTFGTAVDFYFAGVDPPGADVFTLLLEDSAHHSLLTTTDPGGTNRLFEFFFDPAQTLNVYSDTNPSNPVTWSVILSSQNTYSVHIDTFPANNSSVPEPAGFVMWSFGALGVAAFSGWKSRRVRA